MSDSLSLIRVRLREIEKEVARFTERLKALSDERDELGVAERVLSRLHSPGSDTDGGSGATPEAANGSPKPEDLPSMPEMISAILRDAHRVGVRAMEPSQIAHAIAKRYWDGIRRDAVPSIAWRMWKRGDLKKYGAMYRLPENETPDTVLAERSGASFDGPLALAFDGPEEGGGT